MSTIPVTVLSVEYDPGTLSAPAFLSLFVVDPEGWTRRLEYQGKQAKRMVKVATVGAKIEVDV